LTKEEIQFSLERKSYCDCTKGGPGQEEGERGEKVPGLAGRARVSCVRRSRSGAAQAASDPAGLPVVVGREGRVPFNTDGGPRSSRLPLCRSPSAVISMNLKSF